jgi:hypothetical protein
VGRRRLERVWLARLRRNGHPHPERGLALRVAAFAFVAALPRQIAQVRRSRTK